tara:strand:- start:29790 stop:30095 length:306 start_codon:yes stop_codon:yes gene_type:complete
MYDYGDGVGIWASLSDFWNGKPNRLRNGFKQPQAYNAKHVGQLIFEIPTYGSLEKQRRYGIILGIGRPNGGGKAYKVWFFDEASYLTKYGMRHYNTIYFAN